MRAWLPFLLFSFLAYSATAQEPCSPESPCGIPLDMDESTLTFGGAAEFSVTAGDTISFDAFNTDDVAHDITIADLGIEFTVEPLADSQHGPYTMDAPGNYTVTDITTGATATLRIVLEDVATGTDPKRDGPALSLLAAVSALVALAVLRRG